MCLAGSSHWFYYNSIWMRVSEAILILPKVRLARNRYCWCDRPPVELLLWILIGFDRCEFFRFLNCYPRSIWLASYMVVLSWIQLFISFFEGISFFHVQGHEHIFLRKKSMPSEWISFRGTNETKITVRNGGNHSFAEFFGIRWRTKRLRRCVRMFMFMVHLKYLRLMRRWRRNAVLIYLIQYSSACNSIHPNAHASGRWYISTSHGINDRTFYVKPFSRPTQSSHSHTVSLSNNDFVEWWRGTQVHSK